MSNPEPTISATKPDPRRWAALAVLLTGAFLPQLDFFIVNVAMPAIRDSLGASPAAIQLVISGYAIVYAVFLITGGRLGDIFGRKTMFLGSLVGFSAASALCGLAWSPNSLIAGRLLQGLTAASLAPQALASVPVMFPPNERARALSIFGIFVGLASIAGQALGGALVTANIGGFGWRLIFLINLPVGLIAFIAAMALLRDSRGAARPRLDLGGVVLSALALTAFVLPLVEGREQGWPLWTILMLVASPLLAEGFRRYEMALAARGGEPLVDFAALRPPGLKRGLGAMLMLFAQAAFFLTYAIYLQGALNLNPLMAGLAIAPFSVGFLTGSTFSPRIAARAGRMAPSVGFVSSASGQLLMAAMVSVAAAGQKPALAPAMLALALIGFGMGMSIPTLFRVLVERTDARHAGLVAGLANSILQVSAALGVALIGAIFFISLGDRTDPGSIGHAFALTLVGIATCHLTGAALAAGLGQPRGKATPGVAIAPALAE